MTAKIAAAVAVTKRNFTMLPPMRPGNAFTPDDAVSIAAARRVARPTSTTRGVRRLRRVTTPKMRFPRVEPILPYSGVIHGQRHLKGLKVAILATDGFEQSELTEPRKALDAAGADTEIVSPKPGKVRGWKMKEWGEEVPVDQALDEADPEDYDALVLPGGVINADALRLQPKAVNFVKAFFDADKPVGVICHASWALIESGLGPRSQDQRRGLRSRPI